MEIVSKVWSKLTLRNVMIALGVYILLVVLFKVVMRMSGRRTEKMEVLPSAPEHSMELVRPNIKITPTAIHEDTKIIESGPEFQEQKLLSPWYKAYTGNLKNYYLLDDGAGGSAGLHFNQCSKSCCSDQYPLPFKMPADAACDSKDEFVPTNYTCNNAWQDSGCVCLTKDQANLLGSRGGNA